MDGCRIAEAADVLCHCRRRKSGGIGAPARQTGAQEVLCLRTDQAFREVIGLNQEEPVVVSSRELFRASRSGYYAAVSMPLNNIQTPRFL